MDLMYEHYLIDNPPPPEDSNKFKDGDYDRAEENVDGYNDEQAREEGRLPLADNESFEDPDFDSAWNEDNEDTGNTDEWEEV